MKIEKNEWSSMAGSWIVDAPWWATSLMKLTVVLAVAWIIHVLLRHTNPQWRVVLWRAAAVGLVAVVAIDALRLDSFAMPLDVRVSSLEPATTMNSATSPVANPSEAIGLSEPTNVSRLAPQSIVLQAGLTSPASLDAVTYHGESTSPHHWLRYAGIVWLVGVLLGALRFIIGRWRLAKLVATATVVPPWISELAQRISSSMDTAQGVVRGSTDVRSPMVCRSSLGYTLLIPQSLVESSSREEMTAILTHEFVHVRSRDLHWNVFIRMITTLLWPHPLVWRMATAHVTACEYAADAESARRMGDPAIYVQTLAKVALGAAKTTALPALAMARVSDVRKRLGRVHETFQLPPLRPRHVFAIACVVAGATTGLGVFQLVRAQVPEVADSATVQTPARVITVQIVDETNQAIKDATLKASVFVKDVKYESQEDTDVDSKSLGDGKFEVALAAGTQAVMLRAAVEKRVPMAATWREEEVANELPDEFTFTLPPGTKISGQVIDEQGDPIAGADVYLLVIADRSQRQQADLSRKLVKTDVSGVWTCEVVPEKINNLWIRLTHADYASDSTFGETAGQVSIDEVRSGKHTMVMKKGVTVQGTILDIDGKPVAQANVYQGSDRFGSSFPETKTDDTGQFLFANNRPGEMVLTIIAKGFAPELQVVQVDAQTQPISITLPLAKTLRIRTVDAQGNAIAGVMIAPDTWREHRSLADIDMPRETDKEGRFVWNDAPADAINYSILKQEWMDQRDVGISPKDDEIVVKMLRPLVISGKVTDAATGKPIEDLTVVAGIKWEQGDTIHWSRELSTASTTASFGGDGTYAIRCTYPRPGHMFQIEAPGYEPAQSRLIQSDEGTLSIDFALKPAKLITGTVLTPDGEPAAGADVVMALPNVYVNILNGRMNDYRDQPYTVVDAQGNFTLPSQKDPFKLIALHDSGVSIVVGEKLQSGQVIRLSPWAKIVGTVKIGSKPAAQSELNLFYLDSTPYNDARFTISSTASADASGRFEFARVLPDAEFQLSRAMPRRDGNGSLYTHGVTVKTRPGATENVSIGATGRPIVGRMIVPETASNYVWTVASLTPNLYDFDKPDGYNDWTQEKKSAWYTEWIKTGPGEAHAKLVGRRFAIDPQADGSFRVEDLPAGRYDIQATITAALGNKQCGFGEQLGSVQQIITVPEMEGGRSDEILDIGELKVKLRKFLSVGDEAPELAANLIDGEPIAIADLRGKYVLLDFWATWCGPCLAELPTLEKAKEKFGDRDDFVILGVNMDAELADAKKYLDANPHGWLQSHISQDRFEEIQESFGIVGIPATFLIGPDGKILAKDLRGEALIQGVSDALQK